MEKESLKIYKRQYTTEQGLQELQDLVEDLNMKIDSENVDRIESQPFLCHYYIDNELTAGDHKHNPWINHEACWSIEDGNLRLDSICNLTGDVDIYEADIDILKVKRINFPGAIKQLEVVIVIFNNATIIEDRQIKEFLEFCDDFKNADTHKKIKQLY